MTGFLIRETKCIRGMGKVSGQNARKRGQYGQFAPYDVKQADFTMLVDPSGPVSEIAPLVLQQAQGGNRGGFGAEHPRADGHRLEA